MLDKVKNVLTIKKICYLFFFVICFLLFIFDLKSEKLSVNLLFGLFAVTILLIISFLNYKFKKIDDKSYYKFYAFAVFVIGFILISIIFMIKGKALRKLIQSAFAFMPKTLLFLFSVVKPMLRFC